MTSEQAETFHAIMNLLQELPTPRDAGEVVLLLHLHLWMNYKDDASVDTMLTNYCDNFKRNFRMNLDA